MAWALTGARVFDGTSIRDGLAVAIDGTHIAGVMPERDLPAGLRRETLDGGLLAPGFIDVQANGGGGALLNAAPVAATVRQIAEAHRRFGTTGLLPTVITDAPEAMRAAMAAVGAARAGGARSVLGIHIEGPFIDPARKGAHAARYIRDMTAADMAEIAGLDCGHVMLTLAPNRVPPAYVRFLAERGVLISLGHSDAGYDSVQQALAAGARGFTHLFNAMSQLGGREPGMAGAALADRGSYCGLIADGLHVHDAAMKVALAARGHDRIMLVSDAMPTAAGGPDSFELQGRRVRRVGGRLQLDDGTLAGCNLTLDEAVRYCVARLDVGLEEALRMASLVPAAFLRRDHDLGRIAPGYIASLVHLGDDLQVRRSWVEGR